MFVVSHLSLGEEGERERGITLGMDNKRLMVAGLVISRSVFGKPKMSNFWV